MVCLSPLWTALALALLAVASCSPQQCQMLGYPCKQSGFEACCPGTACVEVSFDNNRCVHRGFEKLDVIRLQMGMEISGGGTCGTWLNRACGREGDEPCCQGLVCLRQQDGFDDRCHVIEIQDRLFKYSFGK